MKLKKFHKIIEETPADVREHVKLSMDILERIHELLEKKFGGKQKLLAEKLNKSEAEVSKWLTGVQNFTTKTLVKLELAFGEPIISVCKSESNATLKTPYKKMHAVFSVGAGSEPEHNDAGYKKINKFIFRKGIGDFNTMYA